MKFGIFGPHWLQFPVVFPHDTGQLHRTVKGAVGSKKDESTNLFSNLATECCGEI